MLKVNEEILKAIKGLYADHDCGAYLSLAKISNDKFLWCFWNRKDDVHDEKERISHPVDYGYEETFELAEARGWKVLKENRPPEYRGYHLGVRGWDVNSVYLCKTEDRLDGGNPHQHGRGLDRNGAAWAFHRRLIAERKLKRKRKVGEGQEVEYVYVHFTYTREYFDRTSSRHRRKKINLRDGWSYYGKKKQKHQTDQYRVVQKTDRYIYLQGKPVSAKDFESFQDYRDHQARRYRLDRGEFDTAGMVYHSRLGWVAKHSVHPESAVPDTVSALLDLECFTLLGITTICSDAEVKKAFRKKVKGLHPDSPEMIGKSDAEFREATLKFMAIGKAKDDVLSRLAKHRKRKKGKK